MSIFRVTKMLFSLSVFPQRQPNHIENGKKASKKNMKRKQATAEK